MRMKDSILLPVMSLLVSSDQAEDLLAHLRGELEFNDDGEVLVPVKLPIKRAVCERCEGYGTHLNPSIGEHAYTAEEFNEEFDDEGKAQYFRRGGIYDVQCYQCHGQKVVDVVDREACKNHRNPLVSFALQFQDEQDAEEARYQRMCADERRMGA